MTRLPRRSIPATLLGLIVLAICVLVAVSAIQLLAGYRPLISFTVAAELGARQRWSDTVVLLIGGAAAALGVLLLACGLWPGAPTVLALDDPAEPERDAAARDEDVSPPFASGAGVTRRGLTTALRASLHDTDGVTPTKLRLRHHRIRVTLRTECRDTSAVYEAARSALHQRLQGIPLRRAPRLRLRVTRQRRTA